jgi:hypothetical protein
MLQLREKKVGPYTVRELSMRDTLALLKQYPEASDERNAAMLGASVWNGADTPVGPAVLDFGAGVYRALLSAHQEVNAAPDNEAGEQGNG